MMHAGLFARIDALPFDAPGDLVARIRVLASGGNDKVDCLLGAIRLADAGADSLLIGETLMRSQNILVDLPQFRASTDLQG